MTALRVAILVLVIALGTVLAGWWAVPLVGAAYGLASRSTGRPGTVAAVAAFLAWSGYLAIVSLGGAPVGTFAAALAKSMGLPAVVPLLATPALAALLAGPAAYLAARIAMPDPPRFPG